MRIALVATNASFRLTGGEAARPVHYFRRLRAMGADVLLVAHDRNRRELEALFPEDADRLFFTPDTRLQRFAARLQRLSRRWVWLSERTIDVLSLHQQRKLLRRLVPEKRINVVHQVTPISPKLPSFLYGLGVPVIIGPMNGDMAYPPALGGQEGWLTRSLTRIGRAAAQIINWWIPGKREAAVLLVSNERTRQALPRGCRGEVLELTANAVDMADWNPDVIEPEATRREADEVRFVFVGRLVAFKAVDMLLEAFAKCRRQAPAAHLSIIGDGVVRSDLERQAEQLGIDDVVTFHGRLTPDEVKREVAASDVFAFPSLRECGGAVIMETMALAKPIITVRWGGPADYAHDRCAILLEPRPRPQLIDDLAEAMIKLAHSPELRRRMGAEGRRTAEQHFDWSHRLTRLMEIYRRVR